MKIRFWLKQESPYRLGGRVIYREMEDPCQPCLTRTGTGGEDLTLSRDRCLSLHLKRKIFVC